MKAESNPQPMRFARLDRLDVVAYFDGGAMSSDAGALLLGATDWAIALVDRFGAYFTDERAAGRVEHQVRTLVGQRVLGIALGYEDLIDHDDLRCDPVLATVLGKLEPPAAGVVAKAEWMPGRGENGANRPKGRRPQPDSSRRAPKR